METPSPIDPGSAEPAAGPQPDILDQAESEEGFSDFTPPGGQPGVANAPSPAKPDTHPGMTIADALRPSTVRQTAPGKGGMSIDEAMRPGEEKTTADLSRQRFRETTGADNTFDASMIYLGGATEAAIRTGVNYVPDALNAVIDFAHRNLLPQSMGGGTGFKPLGSVGMGDAEKQFWNDNLAALKEIPHWKDLTDTAKAAYAKVDQALGHGPFRQMVNNATASVGDVLELVPGLKVSMDVAAARGTARSASQAARQAMPLWKVLGYSSPDAATAEGIGFRSGRGLAGKFSLAATGMQGRAILTNNNIEVGNVIAHHVSGVPFESYLSPETLKAARAAPNALLDRAGAELPTGPLDKEAREAIREAGDTVRITKGSPNVQQQLADLRERLMDPQGKYTGEQVMGELRALRQEGFAGLKSEDVDVQALSKAKLRMADAIEGHIDRNLDPKGTVTLERVQAARQAIAQNLAVSENLQGNDVDLASLGRDYARAPEQFKGPLRTAAIFAENNGTYTGKRVHDVHTAIRTASEGRFNLTEPGTWMRGFTITGLPKRLLRGNGVDTARSIFKGRDPKLFELGPMRAPEVDPSVVKRAFSRTREEPNAPGGASPNLIPKGPYPHQGIQGPPPQEGQLPSHLREYSRRIYSDMNSDFD